MTDVRGKRREDEHVDKPEAARDVDGGGHARNRCHAGNPRRTDQAAVIVQVGLNDIHAAVGNHPAELAFAGLLFSPRHRYGQRIGNLFRVFVVVKGAGLFKVDRLDVFEHPSYFDGLGGIVGTVRVGMDVDVISQRLPGQGDEGFRAARCSIFVSAHPAANSEFDGPGAGFVHEALQVFDFFFRGAVPPPAGHVEARLVPHGPAHQVGDGPAGGPAEEIQQRKFDPGHRAPQGLPLDFVVALVAVHAEQVFFQVSGILPDEVGNDQLVEDGIVIRRPSVRKGQAFGAVSGPGVDVVFAVFFQ